VPTNAHKVRCPASPNLSRPSFKIPRNSQKNPKKEQKRRFLARLETAEKNWKFSPSDIAERAFWDDYQEAFEEAIEATNTKWAPWFILPADHKWVTRTLASEVIVKTIESLDLEFPKLDAQQLEALKTAGEKLKAENN
jgi:hypothetical protein